MTTTTTAVSSGPYIANSDTTFPVTFQSAGVDEIGVTVNSVVLDPSLYVFNRTTDGTGSVVTSLPISGTVIVYSLPNFQEEGGFERFGDFYPDQLNPFFDRAVRRDQYLKASVDRTLRVPDGESMGGLPALPYRAGKYLGFDTSGNPAVLDSSEDLALQLQFQQTPRRLSYGPRDTYRSYREALVDLPNMPSLLVGFAAYAGTTGGLGYGTYYVNNPSTDPGVVNGFGWAYNQVLNAGGGNIVFEPVTYMRINLGSRFLLQPLNNCTLWAPNRNVVIWADRLDGALFTSGVNNIFNGVSVRPRGGPQNGTSIGADTSTARTLWQVDQPTSDKLAWLNCDIRHPSWHCLDITRGTADLPDNFSHLCRFSVQNSIFMDAIQGHLIGCINKAGTPSTYTTRAEARTTFGTFHQCIWAYNLQRNPKVLGHAYVDMVDCLTILRPMMTEYVDRPDLGLTYPTVQTDIWGAGVQEGGWLRARGSGFISAHATADGVDATHLLVGNGGDDGRISVQDCWSIGNMVFNQKEPDLIDALPYTLPHTPAPAVGAAQQAFITNLWAKAGAGTDAAPRGLFVPTISATEYPNGETLVLSDFTDRSTLLERVDPLTEYEMPPEGGTSGASTFMTPRAFTHYVGKAGGKSTGAAIGATFLDITSLTSGYMSVTAAAAATIKHVVDEDGINDGLHLLLFGSTSIPITLTSSTTISGVTVDTTTDIVTATGHGETASGFVVQIGGTPPAPLAINTIYYGIYIDANTFKLATTYDNALAGTAIDLTSAGTSVTATFGSFNLPNGNIVLDSSAKVVELIFNTSNNRYNVVSPGTTLASGTYTPTLTAVANCTGLTVNKAQYQRNGNIAVVTLQVAGTQTTGSTLTKIGVSLPVASNLIVAADLIGGCNMNAPVPLTGYCNGDPTNDRAEAGLVCSASAAAAFAMNITFQYEIK